MFLSLQNARIPIIGFVAPSGSGKTTLLRYVIAQLYEQDLRVGVVKQARADFDLDQPGKDSYELRKAGIERLLLASERQSALIIEHENRDEAELNQLLSLFEQATLDLILVEGFQDAPIAKIAIHRQVSRKLKLDDAHLIAIASDTQELDQNLSIPVFDIDDVWSISDFIVSYMKTLKTSLET